MLQCSGRVARRGEHDTGRTETVTPASAGSERLQTALASKQARVAVVGLGFAGLPQAVVIAEAGFTVTGIDVDGERVAQLARGESYITDVTAGQLQSLAAHGALSAPRPRRRRWPSPTAWWSACPPGLRPSGDPCSTRWSGRSAPSLTRYTRRRW